MKLKAHFTSSDPEHSVASGGVGCIYAQNNKLVPIEPRTPELQNSNRSRFMLSGIPLQNGALFLVVNTYMWTGGGQHKEANARTEDLAHNIMQELHHYQDNPILVIGDFNSALEDIAPFANAINDGILVDIGSTDCLLYTSPSPRDPKTSRMPSSA